MVEFHNVFALLDENDVVEDIILANDLNEANSIAINLYVSGKAICVNKYDVKIGDFYKNRTFYRCVNPKDYSLGFEVDSTLSLEEQINNLTSIIGQKESHIEYLENLLRENGLEKLIE